MQCWGSPFAISIKLFVYFLKLQAPQANPSTPLLQMIAPRNIRLQCMSICNAHAREMWMVKTFCTVQECKHFFMWQSTYTRATIKAAACPSTSNSQLLYLVSIWIDNLHNSNIEHWMTMQDLPWKLHILVLMTTKWQMVQPKFNTLRSHLEHTIDGHLRTTWVLSEYGGSSFYLQLE